jgi:hypothetical protein
MLDEIKEVLLKAYRKMRFFIKIYIAVSKNLQLHK